MIKKEELIKELKESISWEDGFIAKYGNEDVQALLESLPEEKLNKIKPLLNENINDTLKHSDRLNELVKKIKEENKDDY